jgi:hypothetical protein
VQNLPIPDLVDMDEKEGADLAVILATAMQVRSFLPWASTQPQSRRGFTSLLYRHVAVCFARTQTKRWRWKTKSGQLMKRWTFDIRMNSFIELVPDWWL